MKSITRELEIKEYPEIPSAEIKQKIAICAKGNAWTYFFADRAASSRLSFWPKKCAIEKEKIKLRQEFVLEFLDLLLKPSSKSDAIFFCDVALKCFHMQPFKVSCVSSIKTKKNFLSIDRVCINWIFAYFALQHSNGCNYQLIHK